MSLTIGDTLNFDDDAKIMYNSVSNKLDFLNPAGTPMNVGIQLGNISGIDLTGVSSGKVLGYDGTNWVAATPGGGGISDAPSDGNAYTRTNGAWGTLQTQTAITDIDTILTSLTLENSLQDVMVGTQVAGDELVWDNTNSRWIPGRTTPANQITGTVSTFDDFPVSIYTHTPTPNTTTTYKTFLTAERTADEIYGGYGGEITGTFYTNALGVISKVGTIVKLDYPSFPYTATASYSTNGASVKCNVYGEGPAVPQAYSHPSRTLVKTVGTASDYATLDLALAANPAGNVEFRLANEIHTYAGLISIANISNITIIGTGPITQITSTNASGAIEITGTSSDVILKDFKIQWNGTSNGAIKIQTLANTLPNIISGVRVSIPSNLSTAVYIEANMWQIENFFYNYIGASSGKIIHINKSLSFGLVQGLTVVVGGQLQKVVSIQTTGANSVGGVLAFENVQSPTPTTLGFIEVLSFEQTTPVKLITKNCNVKDQDRYIVFQDIPNVLSKFSSISVRDSTVSNPGYGAITLEGGALKAPGSTVIYTSQTNIITTTTPVVGYETGVDTSIFTTAARQAILFIQSASYSDPNVKLFNQQMDWKAVGKFYIE